MAITITGPVPSYPGVPFPTGDVTVNPKLSKSQEVVEDSASRPESARISHVVSGLSPPPFDRGEGYGYRTFGKRGDMYVQGEGRLRERGTREGRYGGRRRETQLNQVALTCPVPSCSDKTSRQYE